VAAANYRYFVLGSVFCFLYLALTNGIGLYLGAALGSSTHLRTADRNMLAGLAVIFVVNTGAVIGNVVLLGWHVYFAVKGITTYTYILFARERTGMRDLVRRRLITMADYRLWARETEASLTRFTLQSGPKRNKANRVVSALSLSPTKPPGPDGQPAELVTATKAITTPREGKGGSAPAPAGPTTS
jgi:hypothetical protein